MFKAQRFASWDQEEEFCLVTIRLYSNILQQVQINNIKLKYQHIVQNQS